MSYRNNYQGIPIVAQWVKSPTSIPEYGVRFLVSLSGLRIQHCHKLQRRSQMRLGSGAATAVQASAAAPI